jgi:hypothetical protein
MKATYSIEELALFPRYQTRVAYEQKSPGSLAPAFNPNRRPKYWEDPNAANSPLRNVTYPFTIAVTDRGMPAVGPDGKPFLETLQLPKMEAATVNIPPDGTNIEGADVYEVGMPLKPLPSGHELFFQFGGLVAVKDVAAFAEQVEGFTAADRALIQAIAKKLGV